MTEQQAYDAVKKEADVILGDMGFSWDCLPDTNSIWDWVDKDMSKELIKATARDCCWDRLVDGGLDNETATSFIYGDDE